MPYRRSDWHEHLVEVWGEYKSTRAAVDRLRAAIVSTPDLLRNDRVARDETGVCLGWRVVVSGERRSLQADGGVKPMSTASRGLTVKQYDRMVEKGILPETNRFELIEGRIVEKDVKNPAHPTATRRTMRAIERLLPPGWHVRKEDPVRIPNRRSEPEPDLAVVRGDDDAYEDRHPGPQDVALVVEVTRSSVAKDRKLARVYGRGGIPVYWIVNLPRRQLEVYSTPYRWPRPPERIQFPRSWERESPSI